MKIHDSYMNIHTGTSKQTLKSVLRVDTDPALLKLTIPKELMRTAIELVLDINPSLKIFTYNRT